MKQSILALLIFLTSLTVIRCTSDKVKDIHTDLKNQEASSQDTTVGVNQDGNMVVQKNVNLAKELRRLEQELKESEDRVFGTRAYNTTGLDGQLKKCAATKSEKDQKELQVDPFKRLSDTDHDLNLAEDREAGTDAKTGKLIVQTEEKLSSKIKKLTQYRTKLIEKEDEIRTKLAKCKSGH